MPGKNGGWLLRGNAGHDGSNAGAPKSRVKKNAGLSAEMAEKMVRDALRDHESGSVKLPFGQLLKAREIANKVAFGEQTEVVLSADSILDDVSEAIADYCNAQGIPGDVAMGIYDAISARLKDR